MEDKRHLFWAHDFLKPVNIVFLVIAVLGVGYGIYAHLDTRAIKAYASFVAETVEGGTADFETLLLPLRPDSGSPAGGRALVADHLAGKAHQDRRQGRGSGQPHAVSWEQELNM